MRPILWFAGTAMGSLAFQLSVAIWPEKFKTYGWAVKYLWIGWGLCLIVWIVSHEKVLGRRAREWRDKNTHRPKVRRVDWKGLAESFKNLNDSSVCAMWERDTETDEYKKWDIMGGSMVLSNKCRELCKEAGHGILGSAVLLKKYPDLSKVEQNDDRWLFALRQILNAGRAGPRNRSKSGGSIEKETERGEIGHLSGMSEALCLRFFNDENGS